MPDENLCTAVWRNWQTRLIQNQVPSGSEGSSPFTAIFGIATECIFPQGFAKHLFLDSCESVQDTAALCSKYLLDEPFGSAITENAGASTRIRLEFHDDILALVDSTDADVATAASDLIAILDMQPDKPILNIGG